MRIGVWSSDVGSSDLAAGLVPAIAQQHDTGEVLMMAWINRDAIAETLASGRVCYWSRSRRSLWRKGESSGQIQRLVELLVDCDGDTLLLRVDQTGVACHTGRRSCFRSEEHTSELQSLMRISYAVFCLKKKKQQNNTQ